jgi:pimeloyl-ACP methyl ester carboxylesterase
MPSGSRTAICVLMNRRYQIGIHSAIILGFIGTPGDQREKWTSLHADLAEAVPGGRHIVLADTDHAINQERPAEIAEAILRVIGSSRG